MQGPRHTLPTLLVAALLCALIGVTAAIVRSGDDRSAGEPSGSPTTSGGDSPADEPSAEPGSKANIVLILTDDLDAGPDVWKALPKTNELLVEQGLAFDNFFVSTALCCPSRATILTGQYAHNTGVETNAGPNGGYHVFDRRDKESDTIAVRLESAGYYTALLGKYLNGYPKPEPATHVPFGWAEWYVPVAGSPYKEFNYTLNETGTEVKYGKSEADYLTDVIAEKATSIIEQVDTSTPLFLELAPYAPHSPSTPAPRDEGTAANTSMTRSPAFNEDDVSDKPEWVQQLPPLSDDVISTLEEHAKKRIESLGAVDDLVAEVVDALDRSGRLDDTYIVFTSDNGYHLGEHRLVEGKQSAYDTDIRVPFVVRGPGVPAGSSTDALAGNVDIAATFAEIAGVPADDWDGRSLLSTIDTAKAPADWRTAYLLEHRASDGDGESAPDDGGTDEAPDSPEDVKPPTFQGLRTAQYLYVEYENGERELYDLNEDPYQLDNIADGAEATLLDELAAQLASLRACAGAACRAAGG